MINISNNITSYELCKFSKNETVKSQIVKKTNKSVATLKTITPLKSKATLKTIMPLKSKATLKTIMPLKSKATLKTIMPLKSKATLKAITPLKSITTLKAKVPLKGKSILKAITSIKKIYKPINKKSKNKEEVSEKTYKMVFNRDKQCRLKNSDCKGTLQLHHINGRGKGRTNSVDNCIMLCDHHHNEKVHKENKKYRQILKFLIETGNQKNKLSLTQLEV
jgi:hypothetical protein